MVQGWTKSGRIALVAMLLAVLSFIWAVIVTFFDEILKQKKKMQTKFDEETSRQNEKKFSLIYMRDHKRKIKSDTLNP